MSTRATRTRPAWAPYALAVLGGVLYFLGWAGFGIWPFELVALVPLWAALEQVTERPWKVALGVGWLYGTVAIAGGYHWMFEFSRVFSSFGWLATLGIFVAFSVYLGLQFGIQGVLYHGIRARGWSVATAALSSLIVTEWLFPKLFPAYLGNAVLAQPLLVQMADLGGPLLVSLLVGVMSLVVFELLRWWRGARTPPVRVAAVALGFIAFALIYGAVRIREVDADVEAAPSLEVGLVQVNMGVFEKQEQMEEGHRRHLEQSRELEAERNPDLLVWPESAYNVRLDRTLPNKAMVVRGDLRSPVLFGGLSVTYESGYRELFNSVYLIENDGVLAQRYDKTHLAMFGEYLPFARQFPILHSLSPNSGNFAAGTHLAPLNLGPWRIATPVCLEAALPGLVRKMVARGNPHLLINLTNDAWFGDTQEPWIHLRLAQLRAIEHRRYLVRATNSGVSAVVDPVGRILGKTDVGQRENLVATVHMMDEHTRYARWGDWPGWASLAVVVFAILGRPFANRRPSRPL